MYACCKVSVSQSMYIVLKISAKKTWYWKSVPAKLRYWKSASEKNVVLKISAPKSAHWKSVPWRWHWKEVPTRSVPVVLIQVTSVPMALIFSAFTSHSGITSKWKIAYYATKDGGDTRPILVECSHLCLSAPAALWEDHWWYGVLTLSEEWVTFDRTQDALLIATGRSQINARLQR